MAWNGTSTVAIEAHGLEDFDAVGEQANTLSAGGCVGATAFVHGDFVMFAKDACCC